MTKILGLDLGVASIGWAFIEKDTEGNGKITKSGVRVIPSSREETSVFSNFQQGKPASFAAERTSKRGMRRNIFRRNLRKQRLRKLLAENGMAPANLESSNPLAIWELRAKSRKEKITLNEIGLVLMHLNNRRGFKSNRKANTEESNSQWMENVHANSSALRKGELTVGSLHFQNLKSNPRYSTKNRIFKRADYQSEFDEIWETQAINYSDVLSDELKLKIGDYTIFYQRPLKSAKHLLSNCRYEKGHKVVPRSSPLFQYFRSFQKILDFRATDPLGFVSPLNKEERERMYNLVDSPKDLDKKGNLSEAKIRKLFELGKEYDLNFEKIEGCRTKKSIYDALVANGVDPSPWLEFDPLYAGAHYDRQPLYKLWHVLYSIDDPEDLRNTLCNKFGFDLETARSLMAIDLEGDYGALSTRAMKKILNAFRSFPEDASAGVNLAGYKHSDSETLEERETRELIDQIPHIKKNDLRNPVVEKVLNQLITLVNMVVQHPELGRPDEIRVELARELKANAEARNRMDKGIRKATKENEEIRTILRKEFGIPKPSRRDIIRYRCWIEQGFQCLYSGQAIPMSELYVGELYELDHIIPRSRMYDDSRANLVIVRSQENKEKDNRTAHDYMEAKGKEAYESYLSRIKSLYSSGYVNRGKSLEKGIGRKKRDYLMMKQKDIPSDFIDRQLRESQYIVKEAVIHLKKVCRNVTSTTGSVTDLLRHQWGVDDLFRKIQMPKYREWGLTYIEEEDPKTKGKEKIKDWSKRLDHRHHAMDAIVVAFTTQGMIQRLNNMNKVFDDYNQMKLSVRRFELPWEGFRSDVEEALESIFVSFRNRRRIASKSKNIYKVKGQKRTQITSTPRGPLHEATIYARKLLNQGKAVRLNKRFDPKMVELIIDKNIQELVRNRLNENHNRPELAFGQLKKEPIVYKGNEIESVLVYDEVFSKRVKLNPDFSQLDSILDVDIKRAVKNHLAKFDNNPKEAFKDLENNPVWYNENHDIAIKSLNIQARASNLAALHENSEGIKRDFVITGNNHHMAIYKTENGKAFDVVVSFWEAFERSQQSEAVVRQSMVVEGSDETAHLVTHFMINDLVLIDCDLSEINPNSLEGRKILSKHLYRVQSLSKGDVFFRHHLESKPDNPNAVERITSMSNLIQRVQKVHINALGELDG